MKEKTFIINSSDLVKKTYNLHKNHMKSKDDAIKRTIEDFKASHGLNLNKAMINDAISGTLTEGAYDDTDYHMNQGFLKEFKKEAVAYALKTKPGDTLNSDVERRLKTILGKNNGTLKITQRASTMKKILAEMDIKLEEITTANFDEMVGKISDKIRLETAEQFANDIINRSLEKNLEIAQWNDNKMTIRFIEMKFSITLPKTQRERIPVLEDLKNKFL